MTASEAMALLDKFREGKVSRERVLRAFQAAPVAELGFATLDTHRALRKGFPEVIFGSGKTAKQIVGIATELLRREEQLLVTRINVEQAEAIRKRFPIATYHETARSVTIEKRPISKRPGSIAVLCAGTSDLPVAEEAAVTADVMGNRVERIYDVGVAGLHRVVGRLGLSQSANVLVGGAGMEGALPGGVAGLVSRPVIAVPTTV